MTGHDTTMTVECRTCPVRELHCGECMVPVLLDLTAPPLRVDLVLDPQERAAVTRLVQAGLVDLVLDPQERAAVTRLVQAGLVDLETASTVRARLDPAAVSGASRPAGGRAVG